MDESSITQNRRSSRSPVLLSATVDIAGNTHAVVLRNLSSEGALIEGERLPIEGSTVVFRRDALKVNGRIVWVEGRYAGLAFNRRLEREELLREIPRPHRPLERQFRRPGFASRPLSDADRRWLQTFAAEPPRREG